MSDGASRGQREMHRDRERKPQTEVSSEKHIQVSTSAGRQRQTPASPEEPEGNGENTEAGRKSETKGEKQKELEKKRRGRKTQRKLRQRRGQEKERVREMEAETGGIGEPGERPAGGQGDRVGGGDSGAGATHGTRTRRRRSGRSLRPPTRRKGLSRCGRRCQGQRWPALRASCCRSHWRCPTKSPALEGQHNHQDSATVFKFHLYKCRAHPCSAASV